jgi:catalase
LQSGVSRSGQEKKTLTTTFGIPVADDHNSLTAGPRGLILMQDVHLLEKLAHVDRERIPVHSATVDEIRKP